MSVIMLSACSVLWIVSVVMQRGGMLTLLWIWLEGWTILLKMMTSLKLN